jgi:hypothetical protein
LAQHIKESIVKALPVIIFAGWIYATSWGTPLVWADESQLNDARSPPQPVAGSPAESNEAADGAQSSASTSESKGKQAGDASGWVRKWFKMGEHIQAEQPNWLSPLATTSGRLKQEFRYDVWQQPTAPGQSVYNFAGGKGLEFILAPRIQLMVGPPSYVAHMGSAAADGYADIPLMLKFRLAAAGPREGDYLLTLLLHATVPAGPSAVRGAMRDAVISPGIAFGKGWGRFDVQSTLGGNLPTGDTAALGRQLISNTALQYHFFWNLWPEVEVNSTFFLAGKSAGAKQLFLTPGLGFGRVRLWRALRFSTAAGMQVAATRLHTYNHRAIFSVRYSF